MPAFTISTTAGARAATAIAIAAFVALAAPHAHAQQLGATVEPVAAHDGKAMPVTAGGQVPDEATRVAVISALRQVYGANNVIDKIDVVSSVGTPANWSANVQKVLTPALKAVRSGQLHIEGTQLTLSGEVRNEAARQQLLSDMAGALNPTYTIKNGLRVPVSEQIVVDNVLANRIIEFETSSATLTRAAKGILDEMVPALQKLTNKAVAIIAHTDNIGSRAINLALSQARAETVKGYLVNKGLDPANLSITGVGPDQPAASNATEEGRSRNRRIEFRGGRS